MCDLFVFGDAPHSICGSLTLAGCFPKLFFEDHSHSEETARNIEESLLASYKLFEKPNVV